MIVLTASAPSEVMRTKRWVPDGSKWGSDVIVLQTTVPSGMATCAGHMQMRRMINCISLISWTLTQPLDCAQLTNITKSVGILASRAP